MSETKGAYIPDTVEEWQTPPKVEVSPASILLALRELEGVVADWITQERTRYEEIVKEQAARIEALESQLDKIETGGRDA